MNLKQFNLQQYVFPREELAAVQHLRKTLENERTDFHLNLPTTMTEDFKTIQASFAKKFTEIHKLILKEMPEKRDTVFREVYGNIYHAGPFFLSLQAFFPTLLLLADDEQTKKWSDLMNDFRILGAYAQTEIGHGSDVRSLETTATFDPKTGNFILNSPKATSTKFWPGGLGIYATHVVCQAKMYILDKSHGVQTFLIQIRDTKTGEALKGVEVGDIGTKFGYQFVDNGYLSFNNVAIPRDSLLAKYIKVDEKGNVETIGGDNAFKFGYGGMLQLRCTLIKYTIYELTRYLKIQFKRKADKNELNEEDKARFADIASFAYTGAFSWIHLMKIYDDFLATVRSDPKKSMKFLNELHTLTAGFKPYSGWKTVEFFREEIYKRNGNLFSRGFVATYAEFVGYNTYEGDNSVLMQQTAKEILKYMSKILKSDGKKLNLPDSARFLANAAKYQRDGEYKHQIKISSMEELLQVSTIEEILGGLVLSKGLRISKKFAELMGNGDSINVIWNDKNQKELIDLGNVYIATANFSIASKEHLQHKNELQQRDFELLGPLILLQGLRTIYLSMNEIVSYNLLQNSFDFMTNLLQAISELQNIIANDCKYIIDSIHFASYELYGTDDLEQLAVNLKEKQKVHQQICQGFAQQFNKLSKL